MANGNRFRMRIVSSIKGIKTGRRPKPVKRVNVKPTTAEIIRAFKRSRGYEDVIARIPQAETVAHWDTQVAYFSVCQKSGSAKFLDLWDCDHFDFVNDMQSSVADCRAWFSHKGRDFSIWGSAQTATGRINCFFNVAVPGPYSCVVQLQSDPIASNATVECLIDNNTFGPLTFLGTKIQPHFSMLSVGDHHFRIRQMSGAFYFLSLTVYRFYLTSV